MIPQGRAAHSAIQILRLPQVCQRTGLCRSMIYQLPVKFSMPKFKDPNVWFQNACKVTEDPVAAGWLKSALLEAINRLLMPPETRRSFIEFLNCDVRRSKRRSSRLRQRQRRGLGHNGRTPQGDSTTDTGHYRQGFIGWGDNIRSCGIRIARQIV
jgi:hypothetical protein